MIKDISPFLCSREECLEDINNSIKSCSRKDLVSKIPHSDLVSLDMNIRNIFFHVIMMRRGMFFCLMR